MLFPPFLSIGLFSTPVYEYLRLLFPFAMRCTKTAELLFRVEHLTFFYERKGAARSQVIQTALIIWASFLHQNSHTRTRRLVSHVATCKRHINSDHSGLDMQIIYKSLVQCFLCLTYTHTAKLKNSPYFLSVAKYINYFRGKSKCQHMQITPMFVPNLSHATFKALTGDSVNITILTNDVLDVKNLLHYQNLL